MVFILGNSRIPLFFWGLGGFFLGILEFLASLRGSKAEGAISRNSRFYSRNSKFLLAFRLDKSSSQIL